MNNFIKKMFILGNAIILSVIVKNVYDANLNDKYILDCMRNE